MKTFDQCVAPIKRKLRADCFHMTRNDADADDLLLASLAKAWKSFGSYDQSKPFKNWIERIIERTWLDEIRARRRRPQIFSLEDHPEGVTEPYSDVLPDPKRPERDIDSVDRCRAALESIRNVDRRIALALRTDKVPYEDIAVMMGKPVGTVRNLVCRGRQELRAGVKR